MVRFALGGFLGSSVPYITLYPAVVFAATMGGLGPGLFATFLSLGTIFYFLAPPFYPVSLAADAVRAALFVSFSIAFSFFSEALRRARARSERDRDLLQITLSSIGDAVISTDADGKITFLNAVAEELTGWSQAEAAGKAISEVFVVRNEKTGLAAEIPVDKVIREGVVVRLANHSVLRSRSGSEIPIEDSAAPIRGNQGVLGAVLVFRDVTARRQSEEALKQSEDRLRAIYDGMYEYMGVLSVDGKILDCNPASLRFANNTLQDVVGRPFWETPWFSATPGMPEIVRRAVGVVATGESVRMEMTLLRPSGEARIFDFSMNPIRNERGEVVMMVPEGRDITSQKRAEEELKRSNAELTRVNRELEEFAYVASHDLQEPLRMVNIYTQLMVDERHRDDAQLAQYGGFIRDGVKRMEGLIQDLLTFSRAVHSDRVPVGTTDLSTALREAISVLRNRIDESGCRVTEDALPRVRGDATQLTHVFQNLLSNALKYSKQGVPPAIHVSAKQDGNFWTVSIRDNGIGFEQLYAERIFGLFKRLHQGEYPGTGLGLAICKRIVERSGGRIWAEGSPGEGATFYFSLPRAE